MELQVSASGSQVTIHQKKKKKIHGMATPDSNFERIDRMVLKMDIAAMEIRLYRKPGIAASSPHPQLQRDGIVHELSLAQVKVSASGKLTVVDERRREVVWCDSPPQSGRAGNHAEGIPAAF